MFGLMIVRLTFQIFSLKLEASITLGWRHKFDSSIQWCLSWARFAKCLAVVLGYNDSQVTVLGQAYGSEIETISLLSCSK